MEWSARNQLRRVVMIERTGGDPDDDELYDYAADGKRVRKVTNRLVSGNLEATETIFLDGCEVRRIKQASTQILERWSSNVDDDSGRLATIYRWTEDDLNRETDSGSSFPLYKQRSHLSTHQGSTSMELDDGGAVISYEEYFPYGGTAFVAGESALDAGYRTFRFVGKDQDDSTGFYVFQFRYYAPFIGNWVSPDPAGEKDGPNLYTYCQGNPVGRIDKLGLEWEPVDNPGGPAMEVNEHVGEGTVDMEFRFSVPADPSTASTDYKPATKQLQRGHDMGGSATDGSRHVELPDSFAPAPGIQQHGETRGVTSAAGESLEREAGLQAYLERLEYGDPFEGVVPGGPSATGPDESLEAEARLHADLYVVTDRPPFEGLFPSDPSSSTPLPQASSRQRASTEATPGHLPLPDLGDFTLRRPFDSVVPPALLVSGGVPFLLGNSYEHDGRAAPQPFEPRGEYLEAVLRYAQDLGAETSVLLEALDRSIVTNAYPGRSTHYTPSIDTLFVSHDDYRGLGELVPGAVTNAVHELGHAWQDQMRESGDAEYRAIQNRSIEYYRRQTTESGARVSDPVRVLDEAVGVYIGGRVAAVVGAEDQLRYAERAPNAQTVERFIAEAQRVYTENLAEPYGYQYTNPGDESADTQDSVRAPFPSELREYVDLHVFGGSAPASIEEVAPLAAQIRELRARFGRY